MMMRSTQGWCAGGLALWMIVGVVIGSSVAARVACGQDAETPPTDVEPGETGVAEEQGEETEPSLLLDEIVVTATRTPRRALDLPYSTVTLDSTILRERSYRSTPEALRDIPGVMVQKTSNGQGSPFIRGFTGFRNLFHVDGIRLNNSVFRDGPNQYWNTVDVFTLDKIEVIKGPSSVLYGSDAIGGTVSATTRDPYSYGAGTNVNGRLFYRYSSAERSHVGNGEVSVGVGRKFGLLFNFTGKDFGDVHAGGATNTQPNTGYPEYDVSLKSEFFITPDAKLVFAYQRVRQNNVPRTHKTIFSKSFKGTTLGKELQRDLDQQRQLAYVQFHAENLDGPVDSMQLSLSWQVQEETRDRLRVGPKRDRQGFEVGTLGLTGQFTSETLIGQLTYGFEYYRDNVSSFSTKNAIQGPVADDATYDLLGLYIQDEIDVTDRLSAVFGARFSYAAVDANNVQDPATLARISVTDSWNSFVGSGRLAYAIVPEHLSAFAGVSQGFRAPNLSDLTRLDSNRTNEIETPSPDLDPERFINYEVGLKTQGDEWSGELSYFYTNISDMIIRTPTGAVIGTENEITKLNAGDGFVQGIEFGASVRPHPNWTVFGNLTWIEGEVDTFPTSAPVKAREPLDRIMPLTGQVGVRYDHPDRRFYVEALVHMAARADRLSTRDKADTSRIPPGGTPGYEVLSVRGGWNVADNVSLTLALENLLDEDYRVHGSGQNEPGRGVVLGVEIRF